VRMSLEENAVFTDGRFNWLSGRQTHLYLVS
jgi:hypothetical protein